VRRSDCGSVFAQGAGDLVYHVLDAVAVAHNAAFINVPADENYLRYYWRIAVGVPVGVERVGLRGGEVADHHKPGALAVLELFEIDADERGRSFGKRHNP
jgi:hypothetical protein